MPAVITKAWSEAEIQSLIERAELLVGRPLAGLIAKHSAAIAVGTAPRHRHRLIELILRLKVAAANPDGLVAGAAAVSAAEINAVLDLYEDWTNSQAFADFQRALGTPATTSTRHRLIQLAHAYRGRLGCRTCPHAP